MWQKLCNLDQTVNFSFKWDQGGKGDKGMEGIKGAKGTKGTRGAKGAKWTKGKWAKMKCNIVVDSQYSWIVT